MLGRYFTQLHWIFNGPIYLKILMVYRPATVIQTKDSQTKTSLFKQI